MNKKLLKISLTVVLFSMLLFLSACLGNMNKLSLYDNEVQNIEAEAYFSIDLPADWQITENVDNTFSAVSPEQNLGMIVIAEFGGFTFHSMENLGQNVTEYVDLENLEVTYVQENLNSKTQYHQILKFTDADGVEGIVDNYIYNPYTSVVYYLFLTCSESEYDTYSRLFSDIINSFDLTKSQEEYYEIIQELPVPELDEDSDLVQEDETVVDDEAEE